MNSFPKLPAFLIHDGRRRDSFLETRFTYLFPYLCGCASVYVYTLPNGKFRGQPPESLLLYHVGFWDWMQEVSLGGDAFVNEPSLGPS